MNVLSLFDGISCGQVALERANIKVDKYYASEIDKHAIAVTMKHYPGTIQLGDACELGYIPGIDLLMGGSPCQDLSIAGSGRGLMGQKSRLFWEYVRIMKLVKPTYFLLENVASMKKSDKEVITSIMGVEPIEIDSALVSAQQRKRLYWTNIPGIVHPEDKGIMLSDVLEDEVNEKYYINTEKTIEICNIEANKRKIGFIGTDSQGQRIYSIHGKSVTISSQGGGWGAKTGLYWIPVITPDRVNKRQNGQWFKSSNAKFYTLTAQDRHGVLMQGQIRKLTPVECERLQTLPDGYTNVISEAQRYKCIGNGWTVDVITHMLKNIKQSSVSMLA